MALPFFYIPTYDPASSGLTLDEDNSRHVIQVLRMRPGEALQLTDGKGNLLTATIVDDHKKKCRVAIKTAVTTPPRPANITIAISPLKNNSRFEWFLEKATEIGVTTIIPLLCERTERSAVRPQRGQNILVSAMLQSQQTWLPALPEPMPFAQLIRESAGSQQSARPQQSAGPQQPAGTQQSAGTQQPAGTQQAAGTRRYIAHCLETPHITDTLAGLVRSQTAHAAAAAPALILIGPEGDFSPKEIEMALTAGYHPVSLGANRLRTETAGIVAATLLCIR